jgi:hypothetical protein
MKKLKLLVLLLFVVSICYSQQNKDSSDVSANMGADLVSRYVWRGLSLSASPNIQPYLEFSYNNFAIGAWGSYATSGNFAEVDLYMFYSVKSLTIGITDYYTEDELDLSRFDHFNWKSNSTNHAVEASLDYSLQGKIPLAFKAAAIVYGNDRDIEGHQMYSAYLELSYSFSIRTNQMRLALGGTPYRGLYAEEASIVHVGLSATRTIKISDHYEMPLSVSLISNPSSEDVFLLFILSF